MRISDWSSDVCSSDLATIFRPTTLTGADAATTGARFERVDLQGQGIRLQPLPGGVVPVSTPEPSAPDPRGQIKTHQRLRDLAEVFTHERSEEHTSAPQSLMHNSYAVVCLKKPNTTSITPT